MKLPWLLVTAFVATGCASVTPPPQSVPNQQGSALLYLPGRNVQQLVRFEVVAGIAIRGGDIILGPVAQLEWMYARPRFGRSGAHHAVATADTSYLWPGGDMPFEIDSSVSSEKQSIILSAIAELNETELNIRPRTAADRDYVVFSEDARGYSCSSHIGRLGGSQPIQVRDCSRGGVMHEIMHAAGFDHEQCRNDRDNHVTIHWDEIQPGHEGAFEKMQGGQDIGPYDYQSLMHYHRTAFSRSGRDTITPHHTDAVIGLTENPSKLDLAGISQLYSAAPPVVPPPALPGGLPGLPNIFCLPGLPSLQQVLFPFGWH